MNLLFVTDTPQSYMHLDGDLNERGFSCAYTETARDYLSQIRDLGIKIVILDILRRDIPDFSRLRTLKDFDPQIEVVLAGAPALSSEMVAAIPMGATDCIVRPPNSANLISILEKIQNKILLRKETYRLEQQLAQKYTFHGMVGKSPGMLELFTLIENVAGYPSTVLITGETGTGKEMVSRAIHDISGRRERPLIPCDCTAIPESLFESELFGYVKGAFTGADTSKPGLFKEADTGTIFLDEIGELPMIIQTKLLRVLEERQYRPLGSTQSVKVDIRVLSATSRDLNEQIRKGQFREDLFHRINIINIHLPPLRERRDDILLLSRNFLEKHNTKFKKHVKGLSQRVQKILLNYRWPGNVRELENLVERAVMLCRENFIDIKDLPDFLVHDSDRFSGQAYPFPELSMAEMERLHILQVLKTSKDNKLRAAKVLGISRQSLYRKLSKYGIPI